MNNFYTLDPDELIQINNAIYDIKGLVEDDIDLHIHAKFASLKLPLALQGYLTRVRSELTPSYTVLSGFCIDDAILGATPTSPKAGESKRLTREDIYLALIANQLGFPFSFATQQSGRLIQTVVPARDKEYSQLGAGSREELVWHTEDAFHPSRPDFILLMCMRNHDCVPTTVGTLPSDLTREEVDLLFAENFVFLPDSDHANHLSNWKNESEKASYERMMSYVHNPVAQSILYGAVSHPYMRIDPKFTKLVSTHHPSAAVYEKVVDQIDKGLVDVSLKPGEILIIDNHRAVHGRRSFSPKYDGTDRWLKKINVTSDIRKSVELRCKEKHYLVS